MKTLGIASHAAAHFIRGAGAATTLPVHTESIYACSGTVTPYFVLAGIKAGKGGAVRVFDARRAAKLLEKEHPELVNVKIRYGSLAYPTEQATHALIYQDPKYGSVLRFRENCETNTLVSTLPQGMHEEDMYRIVNNILS